MSKFGNGYFPTLQSVLQETPSVDHGRVQTAMCLHWRIIIIILPGSKELHQDGVNCATRCCFMAAVLSSYLSTVTVLIKWYLEINSIEEKFQVAGKKRSFNLFLNFLGYTSHHTLRGIDGQIKSLLALGFQSLWWKRTAGWMTDRQTGSIIKLLISALYWMKSDRDAFKRSILM